MFILSRDVRRAISTVRMRIFVAWGAGSIIVLEMAAQIVTFLCFLHLLEAVNLYPTNLFIGTGVSPVCMNSHFNDQLKNSAHNKQ